ncbi:MAG: hypothetical protein U0V72_09700 [Cytophagales bacterium]
MKTEIIHSYFPREGYLIDSALLLTENKIAIFTSKYKEPSFLDVIDLDNTNRSIDLSKILNFDTSNYYKCYFNFGDKFGLIHRAEKLLLFDHNDFNSFEIFEIQNPFKPDKHDRKTNAELASSSLIENNLLFGLADYAHYGFPPRYLCQLEKSKSKKLLGFGKEDIQYKWGKLFELPKHHFPETEFNKFGSDNDWLNIRAISQNDDSIFIHSTGGSNTRLKSGNPFEFNIIAKFDKHYKWLENFQIEKGIGRFSTDRKYFILNPLEKKNKLYFYSTIDFEIKFEISLTAKQNIGQEKATQIKADKINKRLLVYNHRFLNVCRLID